MKPDKFAGINTTQPTSFPRIPLPVVRSVRWGVGQMGIGAEPQNFVGRPMAPQILTPQVEKDRKEVGGWGSQDPEEEEEPDYGFDEME